MASKQRSFVIEINLFDEHWTSILCRAACNYTFVFNSKNETGWTKRRRFHCGTRMTTLWSSTNARTLSKHILFIVITATRFFSSFILGYSCPTHICVCECVRHGTRRRERANYIIIYGRIQMCSNTFRGKQSRFNNMLMMMFVDDSSKHALRVAVWWDAMRDYCWPITI